ncbi:NlpC/P60 family protein [Desulfovermiculus halophilus]|jgi:cell wall-associated NlpC family hydrolase|uniref:NlpC/P60 family protein n=1 Tax=Desulfovermiculus halophilus TaxID=339722 RepID=UPI000685BD88|nr:NlpC/P60 family protein [Desulfovermiculus halophilus]
MLRGDQAYSGFRSWGLLLAFFAAMVLVSGCGGKQVPSSSPREHPDSGTRLSTLGYTIQFGAFAQPGNARRLTARLEGQGLEAYYFQQEGLYKVRFGDFPTRDAAERKARRLQNTGHIREYYVLRPRNTFPAGPRLGEQIVQTARGFLGIPYEWGGTRPEEGFDCSGLTMATYRLNGLKLPRTSRQQYRAGTPVGSEELQKGDLVFFAPGSRVSHVGVYAGNGRFIHAPSTGKNVRISSLGSRYYQNAFAGGRRYIRE